MLKHTEHNILNQVNKDDGSTLLIEAVERNNFIAINALIELGADVNLLIGCGNTALHFAVHTLSIPAFGVLLQHGADIYSKNDNGLTPLEILKNCGHCTAKQQLTESIATHLQERLIKKAKYKTLSGLVVTVSGAGLYFIGAIPMLGFAISIALGFVLGALGSYNWYKAPSEVNYILYDVKPEQHQSVLIENPNIDEKHIDTSQVSMCSS